MYVVLYFRVMLLFFVTLCAAHEKHRAVRAPHMHSLFCSCFLSSSLSQFFLFLWPLLEHVCHRAQSNTHVSKSTGGQWSWSNYLITTINLQGLSQLCSDHSVYLRSLPRTRTVALSVQMQDGVIKLSRRSVHVKVYMLWRGNHSWYVKAERRRKKVFAWHTHKKSNISILMFVFFAL